MLLERDGEVGGTWHENTYPGCRCDVPSHLYSFSFAPNADWSSTFSPQPEILAYLKGCADALRPAARTCASTPRSTGAAWDADSGAVADLHHPGRDHRRGADLGSGRPQRAPASGHSRARELRGHHVPLRALEPRARPDRRARGRDRHGRLGDPVRARRSSRRSGSCTCSSAPPPWVMPHRDAPPEPARAAPVPAGSRGAAGDARGHLLGPRGARGALPPSARSESAWSASRSAISTPR